MKELFRSCDTVRIGFYGSILDEVGIPYFVRNDTTQQSIVGGWIVAFIPLPDFWPTLCALNDDDYPEAMRHLREASETQTTAEQDWKCPKCGEVVPGHFAWCWHCQSPVSLEIGS
jgi:hypothetical protein